MLLANGTLQICDFLLWDLYKYTKRTLFQIECDNIKQMEHYVNDNILIIICEKKWETKQKLSYTMHLLTLLALSMILKFITTVLWNVGRHRLRDICSCNTGTNNHHRVHFPAIKMKFVVKWVLCTSILH